MLESAGDLSEFAVVLSGGRGHFYFASYRNALDLEPATHGVVPAVGDLARHAVATEIVKPQHGTVVELNAVLSTSHTWAVEPSLLESLSVDCADKSLIELPQLDNIAAFQGILGWRRVSLRKSSDANSLASSGVSEEKWARRRRFETIFVD